MHKIIDLITANIHTIVLVYAIGAAVVFAAVLLFFWWICKSEDKQIEITGENMEDDVDTRATVCVALFMAIGCAALWPGIPILLLGVCAYTSLEEKLGNNAEHGEDNK